MIIRFLRRVMFFTESSTGRKGLHTGQQQLKIRAATKPMIQTSPINVMTIGAPIIFEAAEVIESCEE